MYLTRNQAYVQAYRGFESHPLRQYYNKINKLQWIFVFNPHKIPHKTKPPSTAWWLFLSGMSTPQLCRGGSRSLTFQGLFITETSNREPLSARKPAPRRGVSQVGGAEEEQDGGRALAAQQCAHDAVDSAEVRGVAGGGLHQGQECDSPCKSVRVSPSNRFARKAKIFGMSVQKSKGMGVSEFLCKRVGLQLTEMRSPN